ncbi:MAG: hypothetical protein WC352_05465 [Candidatus Omnitrophota bacterium]|jgi:hypothetical protein
MSDYICPICAKRFPRELLVFLDHAETHIIEVIKRKHPEWVTRDGLCPPCVEHFRKSFGKPIDASEALT